MVDLWIWLAAILANLLHGVSIGDDESKDWVKVETEIDRLWFVKHSA